MTKKTHTTKSGDTYEWDETPEVLNSLKNLRERYGDTDRKSKNTKTKI
jgi:hypothetical protein